MPSNGPGNLFPLTTTKLRGHRIVSPSFKRIWKKQCCVKKQRVSVPQLIWDEDEAELGVAQSEQSRHSDEAGMKRGEAWIRGIHWGGSSINTGLLINSNLCGEWTCSTASSCTF